MRKQKKIVSIGTGKRRAQILILTMILILSMQQVQSQEVIINQVGETVLLNKEKTIDVAKIILNEKRLQDKNEELIEIIRKQDSIINSLADKNIDGVATISKQSERIYDLSQDVQRLSDLQLGYEEKKKSQPRLFAKIRLDYLEVDGELMQGVGLNYYGKNIGFGINGGIYKNKAFYGAEIGISIF